MGSGKFWPPHDVPSRPYAPIICLSPGKRAARGLGEGSASQGLPHTSRVETLKRRELDAVSDGSTVILTIPIHASPRGG